MEPQPSQYDFATKYTKTNALSRRLLDGFFGGVADLMTGLEQIVPPPLRVLSYWHVRKRGTLPMRVCMVTTGFPRWHNDVPGNHVKELARHLVKQQHLDVTVLAPHAPKAAVREEVDGVRIRRLRYFWPARAQVLAYGEGVSWNLRRRPLAWLNLPCLLARFAVAMLVYGRRNDLLHVHWGPLGAMAAMLRWLHGRKVVVTIHGSDLKSTMGPIRWLTRAAIRRCDGVIAVSREFHKMCLDMRSSKDTCVYIPHGVEAPPEAQLAAARQRGGMRIITVGRLIPPRRHCVLVRAFAQLRSRFAQATLTFVGDGPARADLQALAAQLNLGNSCRFVGKVPKTEVSSYLLEADIYVSPTTVETFGLAAVEAAMHALPLIVTPVGFPPELVEEGQTGYVVPFDNVSALASAMAKLLTDVAATRRMGWAVRRKVQQLDLTWSNSAAGTAGLYRQVVGEQGHEC